MATVKAFEGWQLPGLELPEQIDWLPPLVRSGSLGMVFAKAGVGKSYFCFWFAAAVACGGNFLKWSGQGLPARVLYVDGEMGIHEVRRRFCEIIGKPGYQSEFIKTSTTFLTPESFPNQIVAPINSDTGQAFYSEAMQTQDVLFLDNYCALTQRTGRQSDEEVWAKVQTWLTGLRAAGKCVVLVHHAGKSGDQLGTSTKEFPLNWSLNFYKPADYKEEQGARFVVHFAKGRMAAEEKASFTAWYKTTGAITEWTWQDSKASRVEQLKKMRAVGMTNREIALALTTTLYNVKEMLKELEEEERREHVEQLRGEAECDGYDDLMF
jgi:putative DNA primase/helicase